MPSASEGSAGSLYASLVQQNFVCSSLEVDNPSDYKEYSIGYPLKGSEMKVVDEAGQVVPVNTRGEIYVRINSCFKEYCNDPDKTSASLPGEGWFRTGDVGFMSENGVFFCEGKMSDIIISGGLKVAPGILEAVLRSCPGVSNVVCVPVPHAVTCMFQVICACVLLEEGSDVTEDTLRSYCEVVHNDKSRIFSVLPTYYMFVNKFPETDSGKISRRDLSQLAAKMFAEK